MPTYLEGAVCRILACQRHPVRKGPADRVLFTRHAYDQYNEQGRCSGKRVDPRSYTPCVTKREPDDVRLESKRQGCALLEGLVVAAKPKGGFAATPPVAGISLHGCHRGCSGTGP